MDDEMKPFISMTPVVDVTRVDAELTEFLYDDYPNRMYVGWITRNTGSDDVKSFNAVLISRGVLPNTYCLLKMY